jgi:hypothetical protein
MSRIVIVILIYHGHKPVDLMYEVIYSNVFTYFGPDESSSEGNGLKLL